MDMPWVLHSPPPRSLRHRLKAEGGTNYKLGAPASMDIPISADCHVMRYMVHGMAAIGFVWFFKAAPHQEVRHWPCAHEVQDASHLYMYLCGRRWLHVSTAVVVWRLGTVLVILLAAQGAGAGGQQSTDALEQKSWMLEIELRTTKTKMVITSLN